MIDREKVIKGFTVCSEHGSLNGEDCHGHYEYTDNLADIIKANDYSKQCPYNGCKTGCVKTLAKDVLALLKEREPMPIKYKENRMTGLPVAICPKCDRFARQFHMAYPGEETHFCPWCGQAVKWE